jgi:hypothetical protein
MKLAERGYGGLPRLSVFCERDGSAFRLHVDPRWVPSYLTSCLDVHGEAFPVWLDFDDLQRRTEEAGATLESRKTQFGSVALLAEDGAADLLAQWLVTAMASGVRRGSTAENGSSTR